MGTPTTHQPMTGDELIKLRLDQFEEWRTQAAANLQSTMRDVDLQKLETATVKGLLIEVRTEMRGNDDHARVSLARIHERLDEITTAESFEKGREAGTKDASSKTWKVIAWSVTATIGSAGVIVALLALILH